MRKSDKMRALSVAGGVLGAFAVLTLAASTAQADPELPAPPPPLPGPPPLLPGHVIPGPADQTITTQAAPGEQAADAPPAPPTEVQHLSSPTNLPPGTTTDPSVGAGQSRTESYLLDLIHAYQTQEISGKDAILLFTQRPLDPNAMPTNGMPTGPQAPPGTPVPQGAPAPDAPAPDAPPPGAPVLPDSASPPAPGPVLPGLPPPAP